VTFDVQPDPGVSGRYALAGELDLASAPALVSAVDPAIAAGVHDIVLDVRALSFLDSTGISAIIGLSNRLQGGVLTLEGPQTHVARVLRLVRADAFPNLRIEWEAKA
jgi:anti-sigma B factor antagonist